MKEMEYETKIQDKRRNTLNDIHLKTSIFLNWTASLLTQTYTKICFSKTFFQNFQNTHTREDSPTQTLYHLKLISAPGNK